MKGLVCAGGEATRLGELTRVANKHLLPVGSWPMIYYPLQLLERAGIGSVLVVTGKGHGGQMIDLLGDGRLTARGSEEPLLSLDVTYKVQTQPGGIAQVVGMARDFARDERLVVVLGDNIFERSQSAAIAAWSSGGDRAMIFVKDVPDPENFGVVVYEDGRVVDIVEKAGVVDKRYPAPPTNEAVVGLYCFPPDVFDVIERLEPSSRGELEITDVNRRYLQRGRLSLVKFSRGSAWLDTGTHDSLLDASMFVRIVEERQGLKIACVEEIAYRMGYIGSRQLRKLAGPLAKSGYGEYLERVLADGKAK